MNIRLIIILGMITLVILSFAYAMRMVGNFSEKTQERARKETENIGLLYSKSESWEPCEKDVCSRQIIVNHSGSFSIIDDGTYEDVLPNELREKLKQAIIDSDILTKKCKSNNKTKEYSADIEIRLNGEFRKLQYPECEDEIEDIDAVLEEYIHL